jgi:phosphoglycerate dehydrogenase-like enzyme
MNRTVLVTDYSWPDLEAERAILREVDAQLLVARTGEEDELCALAPRADAIMTCWSRVSAAVLKAADHCLTVARYGVGLDNIDVAAATERGMIVTNVPDFCTAEVADHTMALILSWARHIVRFAGATRSGGWDNRAFGPMRRLSGQVLGLVGYGNIARQVAHRARVFGYDVIAYSPSCAGREPVNGVRFAADLVELLGVADVVSLHVPLTPHTRHVIDSAALAEMKLGAVLVNTSRGALVDEEALLVALEQGRVGGATLDVLSAEPPPAGHPLLTHPSVIVTPHAGFDSVEAITQLQTATARNVAAVLRGHTPANIVNPEVLATR